MLHSIESILLTLEEWLFCACMCTYSCHLFYSRYLLAVKFILMIIILTNLELWFNLPLFYRKVDSEHYWSERISCVDRVPNPFCSNMIRRKSSIFPKWELKPIIRNEYFHINDKLVIIFEWLCICCPKILLTEVSMFKMRSICLVHFAIRQFERENKHQRQISDKFNFNNIPVP